MRLEGEASLRTVGLVARRDGRLLAAVEGGECGGVLAEFRGGEGEAHIIKFVLNEIMKIRTHTGT